MQEKKSKKPILILAVVLVLCAAVALGIHFFNRPAGVAGGKTVTVVIDAGQGAPQTTVVQTEEEFLGPMLLAEGLAEGTEGQYGLFITSAGGVEADDSNQEWWLITKGGEDVYTGASETPLADGDTFELTLMAGY